MVPQTVKCASVRHFLVESEITEPTVCRMHLKIFKEFTLTKKKNDDKNFRGTKHSNKTHRSTTDPDARLYRKSPGQEATMSYVANDLIDTGSRVILATTVTQPGITTERDAALEMLDTLEKYGFSKNILTLTADKGYGATAFITELLDRNIIPHIPLLAKYKYEAEPSWKTNTYIVDHLQKRNQKTKEVRTRNHARELAHTPDYKLSQKLRKRVEHIFAEAKICHGLERARCRGLTKMKQQACMTATVQNIKRLVGHMRKKHRKVNINVLPRIPLGVFLRGFMAEFRTHFKTMTDFLLKRTITGNFINCIDFDIVPLTPDF